MVNKKCCNITPVVRFSKTHPDAKVPTRGSEGAAGYDLYAVEAFCLKPGELRKVDVGISVEMPAWMWAEVKGRSGLSLRGVDVLGGVIDPDYRGSIGVLLHHTDSGHPTFKFQAGDRVGQLVFQRFETPILEEAGLSETERGDGGFGSTGA